MFEGKILRELAGMPIRRTDLANRPLALAEPDPLTLANLTTKSLTAEIAGIVTAESDAIAQRSSKNSLLAALSHNAPATPHTFVMHGLVPGIHASEVKEIAVETKPWMAGSSPAKTERGRGWCISDASGMRLRPVSS